MRNTYLSEIIDHFEYLRIDEKWINIKSFHAEVGG